MGTIHKKWKVETLENCLICGKKIERPSKFRKYCSTKCRNRRNYIKKKFLEPESIEKFNKKAREKLEQKRREAGEEMIQCKICGKWFRQVGSHIVQKHKMTARQYREYIGLDVKRGLLPDDLRKLYGEQVKENGTINNLKAGEKYRFKPGDPRAGVYKRSDQTIERLKKQAKMLSKINK